jgi:hypothetical protein
VRRGHSSRRCRRRCRRSRAARGHRRRRRCRLRPMNRQRRSRPLRWCWIPRFRRRCSRPIPRLQFLCCRRNPRKPARSRQPPSRPDRTTARADHRCDLSSTREGDQAPRFIKRCRARAVIRGRGGCLGPKKSELTDAEHRQASPCVGPFREWRALSARRSGPAARRPRP